MGGGGGGVKLEHFPTFVRKNYLIKVVSYVHVITKSAEPTNFPNSGPF